MIRYLCNLQNDHLINAASIWHHNNYRHTTSYPHDYFVITNLCILILSVFLPHSLANLLLSGNHHLVPCIYESVSVLFVQLFCALDSTYKWDHGICLPLYDLFHCIMLSRSIHVVTTKIILDSTYLGIAEVDWKIWCHINSCI